MDEPQTPATPPPPSRPLAKPPLWARFMEKLLQPWIEIKREPVVPPFNLDRPVCYVIENYGLSNTLILDRACREAGLPSPLAALPGDPLGNSELGVPVSGANFGSAGILPIVWAYLALMGPDGLTEATKVAVLSANYIAKRLNDYFPVLYTGPSGQVAHECILDLREITKQTGVTAEDVAKRLIDYGFHAPTLSFPVSGTLMVEPTESEDLAEVDRFIDAMIAIRAEIDRVGAGEWPLERSPLRQAPHTAEQIATDDWDLPYSRQTAGFPVATLRGSKYWPPVRRIDGVHGDRNLICSCPAPEAFETPATTKSTTTTREEINA